MKGRQDGQWWLLLLPLVLGHAAWFGLWVWGGWTLGRAVAGAGSPAWVGAVLGAAGWWGAGTALDWLGYRVSYRVTRGRWEFQPLAGALAGWTLPLLALAVLGLVGGLCWGLALLLSGVF